MFEIVLTFPLRLAPASFYSVLNTNAHLIEKGIISYNLKRSVTEIFSA